MKHCGQTPAQLRGGVVADGLLQSLVGRRQTAHKQTNSRQRVPPVADAADVFTRAHSRKLLTHTHAMGINEWQPRHLEQHNISRWL